MPSQLLVSLTKVKYSLLTRDIQFHRLQPVSCIFSLVSTEQLSASYWCLFLSQCIFNLWHFNAKPWSTVRWAALFS